MISKKCDYALRAMLELALHEGGGPVTIGQIAKARGIPARFLEAILRQLKQAGLCESLRGKEGGYRLTGSAADIPVARVLDIFEPRLRDRHRTDDLFATLWRHADAAVDEVFRTVTYADLADRERRRLQGQAIDFNI